MIARRNKNRKNLQNMLLKKYPIRPLQVIVTLPVNIKVNLMHKLLEKSFRKNLQKSSPVSLDQDNVKMCFHLYRLRVKMGKESGLHKKIHGVNTATVK